MGEFTLDLAGWLPTKAAMGNDQTNQEVTAAKREPSRTPIHFSDQTKGWIFLIRNKGHIQWLRSQ